MMRVAAPWPQPTSATRAPSSSRSTRPSMAGNQELRQLVGVGGAEEAFDAVRDGVGRRRRSRCRRRRGMRLQVAQGGELPGDHLGGADDIRGRADDGQRHGMLVRQLVGVCGRVVAEVAAHGLGGQPLSDQARMESGYVRPARRPASGLCRSWPRTARAGRRSTSSRCRRRLRNRSAHGPRRLRPRPCRWRKGCLSWLETLGNRRQTGGIGRTLHPPDGAFTSQAATRSGPPGWRSAQPRCGCARRAW